MRQHSREDYLYCNDCKTWVDLFKYGDVDDTGHKDCNWRYPNKEELLICIKDCLENGCFE